MENMKVTRATSAPFVIEQLNNINKVCEDYGLYAKIVNYKNGSSSLGAGIYVVVSTDPIPENIKPHKLCERTLRNNQVFYPKDFAVKITPENSVVAFDSIMDFCERSEFLRTLYKEFKKEFPNIQLPDCIRYTEYNGLKSWNEGRFNSDMGFEYQKRCVNGLKAFFKEENTLNKRKIEERKFWRSDRYDEKATWIKRQSDFAKRNEPVVRLDVLMQYCNDVNKICITEDVYEPLVKYLKDCYPEVAIAVDEKKVVDDGMIELSSKLPSDHPAMKCKPVTSAEFNEIIRKNFATEGWRCVDELRPSKWEFRNIYYKEVDEPQFIAALNDLCLAFADPEPMTTLTERGECSMVDVSVDGLYDFVALAKQRNLLFHIDNRGKFAEPSFNNIHIVYNTRDQKEVDNILASVVDQNIANSHIIRSEQLQHAPTLRLQISEAKERIASRKLEKLDEKAFLEQKSVCDQPHL